MKCQHCGNHEANVHYRSNINGAVTEGHFCTICAREAGGGVFAGAALRQPMEEFFGGDLFRRSLFGGNAFSGPLALRMAAPVQAQPSAPPEPGEAHIPTEVDPVLKRRREINQLRGEMEGAIKAENFERAAELRDEIYRLEKDA